MSLWVRRTGQLLLAALFLLACEDENSLLGFRNPTSKFDVSYIEFNIGEGSVLSLQGVLTDNLISPSRILIGEYQDPVVGSIRAISFSEFLPPSSALIDGASVYDSIVLQLNLDFYTYGLAGGQTERFTIHRITEDTLTYYNFHRYYSDSFLEYDPTPLGETEFVVNADSIKKILAKPANQRDTLLATARLSDAFGQELFNLALTDANGEYSNINAFRARMKGLAFAPSQSNSIIGFDPASPFSRLVLHYHTVDIDGIKDTLTLTFNLNIRSFHNISTNLTGEWAGITEPNQGIDPASGLRYVQTGTPHISRIDLNDFYTNFADTLTTNILINTATIFIESVQKPDGFDPIPFFELRVMNESDDFLKSSNAADSLLMLKYFVFPAQNNYLPFTDTGQEAVSLSYNSTNNAYGGSVTLFMQDLLKNKSLDGRLRYLGIYPATSLTRINNAPNFGKIVNRTIFHKNNIKLRVHYTSPTTSNQ
jgi:hypothetical protein